MKNTFNIVAGVIVLLIAIFIGGVFYTIDETEQVVITKFGKLIGQPKQEAGLNFKLPWHTVNRFEKRILEWDGEADQMPTREKRLIWVDTTARWRISNPLKFMKSIRTEQGAQSRLDDIIDAEILDVVSSHVLIEILRSSNRLIEEGEVEALENVSSEFGKTALRPIQKGREALSKIILERSAEAVKDYGIDLVDVKIKRLNYVKEVQNKVFERMISERKRAAEQFRSEGQGKKAEIEGQRTKELQEIQSEAYRTAQEVKGKADAKAIKIYADAYNNDPEFYSFIKTLDTYRKTINKDTTLMFSTENDFYEYLGGAK